MRAFAVVLVAATLGCAQAGPDAELDPAEAVEVEPLPAPSPAPPMDSMPDSIPDDTL